MDHRAEGELAADRVLHAHGEAGGRAQIAVPPTGREPPALRDLQADPVAHPFGDHVHDGGRRIGQLVDHDRHIGATGDSSRLGPGRARRLEHEVRAGGDCPQETQGRLHRHPAVRVDDEVLAGAGVRQRGGDPIGVEQRATLGFGRPDLHRVTAVALHPVIGDPFAHRLGRTGGDGGDHREDGVGRSTEEFADRQADRPAEQIPAGHVDGSLGVWVTGEQAIHRLGDPIDAPRVEAEKVRGHLVDPGPDPSGMGRHIIGTERGRLAPPDRPIVGSEPHTGCVEAGIAATSRQFVDPTGVARSCW